ncbi:hypothetical protein DK853_36380, partial [Klebsiella oxytoca]
KKKISSCFQITPSNIPFCFSFASIAFPNLFQLSVSGHIKKPYLISIISAMVKASLNAFFRINIYR